MSSINLSWDDFKRVVNSGASLKFVEVSSAYYLIALDGSFEVQCYIQKQTPAVDDQLDFETNFKAKGNLKINQIDSDGASFSRTKQAPTGWTYQLRGIEFKTSDVASLVNLDPTGNPLSDATIKLYDSTGAETLISASAVRTVIDLEPSYDYYIIGGLAKIQTTPVNDVRLSVVAVPDVPFSYGGSRIMIQNVNFRFITSNDKIDADGRASKQLTYSATQHTNKLRFIITHVAGDTNAIAIYLEHFKI